MNPIWLDVDLYFQNALVPEHRNLEFVEKNSSAKELPEIAVTPCLGKFLYLIAKISGAKRILEVGTLGGYSTIWLARSVGDDGKVVTLELEQYHAEVAVENFKQAGVDSQVEVQVGPAVDSLSAMIENAVEPFDFVFIDADKENNLNYFQAALQLTKPGATIIVDNVVRDGGVIDPNHEDPRVHGVRRLIDFVSNDDRVECSCLQMVDSKGYDGILVAKKK